MTSKAAEKRYDALRKVGESIVTSGPNADRTAVETTWHMTDRAEVAALIRTLAPLGRTERWLARVEQWARMVEDEDNPFEWAVLQGSVYAGFAAE